MTNESNIDEIGGRLKTGDITFSICSLVLSFSLCLLIFLTKKLNSLTYNFLKFVFISETINSIGNIIEYSGKPAVSKFFIPFSDIFTMLLFCFFTYSSREQLIKSNKNIKNKLYLFIIISAGCALIYGLIFGFVLYERDKNNFYFYNYSNYNYLRFIHVGILFTMSGYICYNTFILLKFLREKQKSDSANSWKIAILIKTLMRFPVICVLYWLIYIIYISISQVGEYKIKYLLKLFAKAFLTLRGFLIGLNTIQTSKIQILIEKIWEVYILHDIILKLNFSRKKKKPAAKGKK